MARQQLLSSHNTQATRTDVTLKTPFNKIFQTTATGNHTRVARVPERALAPATELAASCRIDTDIEPLLTEIQTIVGGIETASFFYGVGHGTDTAGKNGEGGRHTKATC